MASRTKTKTTILIGKHTIERLRRGELVEVNGVILAAADDLFKQPEISLAYRQAYLEEFPL